MKLQLTAKKRSLCDLIHKVFWNFHQIIKKEFFEVAYSAT